MKCEPTRTLLSEHLREAARIGVIGSCVARELKEFGCAPDVKANYIWRSNTVSMLSPRSDLFAHIKDLELPDDSRMTVERDITKVNLSNFLKTNRLVILDYFRDTYDLVRAPDGAYLTRGVELFSLSEKVDFSSFEIVSVYSPAYPDLWFSAALRFALEFNVSQSMGIIVPCMASHTKIANGKVELLHADHFDIHYKAFMLSCMEAIMACLLDRGVLLPRTGALQQGNPTHMYGEGPLHHFPSTYEVLLEMADAPIEALLMGKLDQQSRQQRVLSVLQLWKSQADVGYPYQKVGRG